MRTFALRIIQNNTYTISNGIQSTWGFIQSYIDFAGIIDSAVWTVCQNAVNIG